MTFALAVILSIQTAGVVRVSDSESLVRALANAQPGDQILIEPGNYRGEITASIRGAMGKPVVIRAADPKNPPRIVGGGSGIQLSDSSYVELYDLVIERATGNGINIDDGGTYDTPSHHIRLQNLVVRDLPAGNHDGIKLSGVNNSFVDGCLVERWGGSAVDMVGCHMMAVQNCTFRKGGDSGVQAKGGSSEIYISDCFFDDYGQRGVNAGGSTGMQYFRWSVKTPAEKFEARNVVIVDNTFVGGVAPIAFVGVSNANAEYNTIVNPGRWAIRILQETRDPAFVPSRNVRFDRNLIVFNSAHWGEGGVNIGSGTAPETFTFKENFWFCRDAPARSTPKLPTKEIGGVYGKDPMLTTDFQVPKSSPAAGFGNRNRKPLPHP